MEFSELKIKNIEIKSINPENKKQENTFEKFQNSGVKFGKIVRWPWPKALGDIVTLQQNGGILQLVSIQVFYNFGPKEDRHSWNFNYLKTEEAISEISKFEIEPILPPYEIKISVDK